MKKSLSILMLTVALFVGVGHSLAQDTFSTNTPAPEVTAEVTVIAAPPVATDAPVVIPTPAPEQPPIIITPDAPNSNRLSDLVAIAIAFALYCLSLAGGVQVTVNQLKPLFIDPFKDKLTSQQYTLVIYAVRTIITAVAYFYVWGGVVATRLVVPSLPSVIPDLGVALVTIMLTVLGEEVLHPIIDRLYILRDAAKFLGDLPTPIESSLKAENDRLYRENASLKASTN